SNAMENTSITIEFSSKF
nr:Chain A, Small hydrophobic protein [Human respiratory syncytial virus A2]